MSGKEVFLLDSNAFMTPFRFYYAFDLVPAYWKELRKHIESGSIVMLDAVKDEIEKGRDDLSDWISKIEDWVLVPKVTEQTVKEYQRVMQFVAHSGYYRNTALTAWSPANVADPWLIASAKTNGFTLVTEETRSGGLSKKNPNRFAKIPDVARNMGVDTINVYEMMRRLRICIL